MLWGDLLYLPVQLHLLHASVAHAAPLAVRVTICTAIATIIAMQLIYRRHISRCSATPWRDAAALTCRPWLWLCYANHMVMCAWARFFHRGFGTYVFYVGILACLSGMLMRVRATWHRAEISDKICRASFGIGLARYTRMCLLSMLPHMLLKSAYSPMYVAIFGYSSATTAAQNGAESTAGQHWPLEWILAELLVGYAITIFYIKHGGWWYYTWHRKLHDDPVLYRAIHKWHHLHKPSLPLASGTETCLEWAGAHANPCTLSPWYIVFVQLIDTIEIENHNSASWLLSGGSHTAVNHRPCTHAGTCTASAGANDGPRRGNDYHLKHHLTPHANFGIEIERDYDEKGGSARELEDSDLRFVSRAAGVEKGMPPRPLAEVRCRCRRNHNIISHGAGVTYT